MLCPKELVCGTQGRVHSSNTKSVALVEGRDIVEGQGWILLGISG